MADFTVNDYFQLFGPNEDPTGGPQLALGGIIGGGESVASDALDEQLGLVDNAHFLWAHLNRRALFDLTLWGVPDSTQAAITQTSASYVVHAEIPASMSEGRASVTVHFDIEDGWLKVGVYNASTDALISEFEEDSGGSTRLLSSQTLSGISVVEVYFKVEIKRHDTEASLYSVRALEDAAAL